MSQQLEKPIHETVAYSFNPFIELTDEEKSRLSPKTRKALEANDLIYGKAFLANTLMNANNFRITDNKYIGQNAPTITGRPISFGTKVLEKYHHPRFYEEIDVSGMSVEEAREAFLKFQEDDRIGDILRMQYNTDLDQWDAYYAISHPEIVRDVRAKKLELPKYVSPYFWNLNEPDETGGDLREAEIFHLAYVDDPAYGVEAARVRAYCDTKDSDGLSLCLARMVGAGVIPESQQNKKPPCACGMMAGFSNKLDSSFYIENPREASNKNMSSTDQSNQQTTKKPEGNNNASSGATDGAITTAQEERIAEALKRMKETDHAAWSQGGTQEGKGVVDANGQPISKQAEESPGKKLEIPVEFQDLVNIQIEKERKHIARQHATQLEEKDKEIETLKKTIAERNEKDRDTILGNYIQKEFYKDEKTYKERLDFYKDLAKDHNMSNEKLETLLKDHYEVKELKVSLTRGPNKGKGAGKEVITEKDLNPFAGDSVGMLSSNAYLRGLEAGTNGENVTDDDAEDADEDNPNEGNDFGSEGSNKARGKGAAAIMRGL